MLGSNCGKPHDKVREVVRGECAYSELSKIGIRISRYDELWEVDNPRNIFVEVAAEDVARGLLQFKDDPEKLQSWAAFVLSGSSFIGLDCLSVRPDGDEVLGVLWDAAFNGQFSEQALSLVRSIVSK